MSDKARLLDSTHRRLTIGITLGISVVGFETLGVSTAMPAAARELDGIGLYGWSFTALMLGNLIGIILASGDADERGPFRAYLVAICALSIGLAGGAAAQDMQTLVVTRFIAGLGSGAIMLLNWALIGRAFAESIRSKMLAVGSAAWVVPGLVGPAVSGWVADNLSWRYVFGAVIAPLAIVAYLLLPPARRLGRPDSPAVEPTGEAFWDSGTRDRSIAAGMIAVGVAVVLVGFEGSRPLVAATLVALGVGLILFGGRTLFPTGTLRASPGLPAVVATYALLFAAFTGIESFLPLALSELRGTSSTMAGVVLTCGTSTWAVGSWLQARNPFRWASLAWRMGATAVFAAGLFSMAALTFDRIPTIATYLGWGFAALGMGLAFSSVSEATFRSTAPHLVGRASGATQLAGALLAALVTGIVGAVVDSQKSSVTGFRIGFVGCAVLGLLAFFAGRAVPPMDRLSEPADPRRSTPVP